jgi:mono/diheme cytochrome c family protein
MIGTAALPCLTASSASNGDAKKGQQLFESIGCYACHGLAGQGALATGPRIARTDLPLEAFTMALRSPASDMPPYGVLILSDADAADIFAYLKSMPAPPDPNSISLLYPKGK